MGLSTLRRIWALSALIGIAGLLLASHSVHASLIETDHLLDYQVVGTTSTGMRSFKIRVTRDSAVAATDMPVVVYSHGSAHGVWRGHKKKGVKWAEYLSGEGYVVVNIEHRPLVGATDSNLALAVCEQIKLDAHNVSTDLVAALGHLPVAASKPAYDPAVIIPDSECDFFQAQQVLRWRDALKVRNQLSVIPEIADWWDGRNVVLMGHSAGNASVMSWAGATRTLLFDNNRYEVADKYQYTAFISLSPQNETVWPYIRGYEADAWDDVPQPVLSITGESDETGTPREIDHQPVDGRRQPFLRMVEPGRLNRDNKYLLYVLDDTKPAKHNLMVLKQGTSDQKAVIRETVSAFLDFHVHGTGIALTDAVINGYTGGSLAEFCTENPTDSGDPAVCQ